MKVLVDTSIWVRCLEPSNSLSGICLSEISRRRSLGHELYVCAQVLIELRVVATRPMSANGLGMTPKDVDEALSDVLDICALLEEPADMALRWRALAQKHAPIGKVGHDLRLVTLSVACEVDEILTLNPSDLARFSELAVAVPEGVPSA